MSTPAWASLFARTDEEGRAALRAAAAQAVASLPAPSSTPRSSLSPRALKEIAQSLDICPDTGVALRTVIDEFRDKVWAHAIVPSHPACVAHLHPPTTLASVITEMPIAALNQSMDSWDQAPLATHVELHLMDFVAHRIGYTPTASGVMTSGGTASNVLAMTLARSWAGQQVGLDVLKSGLPPQAQHWRLVCSQQAHFSIQRAAAQLGLGRDSVVGVATTADGSISLDALDHALEDIAARGERVIAIVGTAGTTDLGAIDDLGGLADRARRLGAWFHVDAAVAGALIMSDSLRARLGDLQRADSVTIDFHKLWWQPFNASALIVRDADNFNLLRVRSAYLDRGDEPDDMVNLVGRSLDTSRRFDAAKVVASLRHIGRDQFAAMLEHLVALNAYAAAALEASGHFAVVAPPSCVTCVFTAPGYDAEDLQRVQQTLLLSGEMILGRTTIDGRAALKFTFVNPLVTRDDVDQLIETVWRTLRA